MAALAAMALDVPARITGKIETPATRRGFQ
jgi:hypothetical protein